MNILLDTNILLDVFWNRQPFAKDSIEVIRSCEIGSHNGFINAISLANISYLGIKTSDKKTVNQFCQTILSFLDITPSNKTIAREALLSNFTDLEDALQYYSAKYHGKIMAIITRDLADFSLSDIPVYSPVEFLNLTS